ncbi:hypothetical protein SLS62_007563 [Diatrype stigma]|uniref:Glycosyl hydrolase family 13 catalytic domain-containing protein n=1 Tax=Diatrype stigma TaxID=117547 RepID=A0AAN9YQL0_9PEZI
MNRSMIALFSGGIFAGCRSRSFQVESPATGDPKNIADRQLDILARDNARLPFQWDDRPNDRFTARDAKSWMGIHDDYGETNAAEQKSDPVRILSFYKTLRLRKGYRGLFVFGASKLMVAKDEALFPHMKWSPVSREQEMARRKALVILSSSKQPHACLEV